MFRVIIVEDDLMVASILERQIAKFQQLELIKSFRRADFALEWLEENAYGTDLILLDNYMPSMTGIEFLKCLREKNTEIQVIMITSSDEYSVIRSAMCCGICDYVLKPFTSTRLEKAVSKFETIMSLKADTEVWTQDKVDVLLCPHKHYNTDSSQSAQQLRENKINLTTLANVRKYMQTKQNVKLPLAEISGAMGLSTVTVRRYLKHMNTLGEVDITLDCKTGGRPSEIFEYVGGAI